MRLLFLSLVAAALTFGQTYSGALKSGPSHAPGQYLDAGKVKDLPSIKPAPWAADQTHFIGGRAVRDGANSSDCTTGGGSFYVFCFSDGTGWHSIGGGGGGSSTSLGHIAIPQNIDPTGLTDSSAGINSAANSLSATGGTVYIPGGFYALNSPIIPVNGVSYLGDLPTGISLLEPQGGLQTPTSGTWLNCGGVNSAGTSPCIVGNNVVSVNIANLGFQKFAAAGAITFGGDGTPGLGLSSIRNLYFYGGRSTSGPALTIYNFSAVNIENLQGISHKAGIIGIAQEINFNPGNSLWKNVAFQLNNVSDGNTLSPGISLQNRAPGAGGTEGPLGSMVIDSPQCQNGGGGDGLNNCIELLGDVANSVPITGVDIRFADTEGKWNSFLYVGYANKIIANLQAMGATASTTASVVLSANSSYTEIHTTQVASTFSSLGAQNSFYGSTSTFVPNVFGTFFTNDTSTWHTVTQAQHMSNIIMPPASLTTGVNNLTPTQGLAFCTLSGFVSQVINLPAAPVEGQQVWVRGISGNIGSSSCVVTGLSKNIDNAAASNTGITSGTYTSGLVVTGTVGQTILFTLFGSGNNVATASVALTGTNTIASGTPLVITNPGNGSTAAPTTASAASGTATLVSGTAVLTTTIASVVTLLTGQPALFEYSSASGTGQWWSFVNQILLPNGFKTIDTAGTVTTYNAAQISSTAATWFLGGVTTSITNNGTSVLSTSTKGVFTPLSKSYSCTHGTNATCGVITLTAGAAVIATTAATALAASGGAGNAVVFSCMNNPATTTTTACTAQPSISAITPGTSFTIAGTLTDTWFWQIVPVL